MDDQPRSNSISPLARVSLPGQHRTGFRGGPWEPTERRQRHDLQGAAPPAPAGTGGNTTHTQPALAPPPSDAPAECAWPTYGPLDQRPRRPPVARVDARTAVAPFDQSQARKRCPTQTQVEVINPACSLARWSCPDTRAS